MPSTISHFVDLEPYKNYHPANPWFHPSNPYVKHSFLTSPHIGEALAETAWTEHPNDEHEQDCPHN